MIDEQLLYECKAGDRTAQRAMYDYLSPKLYSVCKRYIKQDTDAEDILAEVFYTIFTKMAMLKETAAFTAWCKKIAVNQCLQSLRKKVNFHVSIDGSGQLPLQHYATSGHQSEQKDLLQLITYLPDGCRTIFNLFAIEGYTHKEIAALLGISEGTSKSQLNVAKNKLQGLVKTFYYQNSDENGNAQ